MKKYHCCCMTVLLSLLLLSCKKDWSIDISPTVEEKAVGGYVGPFSEAGASVLFAVEVPVAGCYDIVVKGRASGDVPGMGSVSCGMCDTVITFAKRYSWSEHCIRMTLAKGVNGICISKGISNGLFYIDYIEIR